MAISCPGIGTKLLHVRMVKNNVWGWEMHYHQPTFRKVLATKSLNGVLALIIHITWRKSLNKGMLIRMMLGLWLAADWIGKIGISNTIDTYRIRDLFDVCNFNPAHISWVFKQHHLFYGLYLFLFSFLKSYHYHTYFNIKTSLFYCIFSI